MTQIASLLAVATVFISLWTGPGYEAKREGLYARQNYLYGNLN